MGARLTIDDSRAADGRRAATVTWSTGEREEIWFERGDGPLHPAAGADPFLIAVMLAAMHRREPLHVEGAVTRRLLAGLEEWQGVWRRWEPDLYQPVEVTAAEEVDGRPLPGTAVAGLSGGVDALFTVYRHTHGLVARRRRELTRGVMIQGSDIALDRPDTFASALERARRAVEGTGIEVSSMRTNVAHVHHEWKHAHGAGLIACLTAFAPEHALAMISGGASYDRLNKSWGTGPVTDPLLSTGQVDVVIDGCDHNRTEKVIALTAWPHAIRELRVCLRGDERDRNCGRCEKCVRTYLNLRAAGIDDPECFDIAPSSRIITGLRVRGDEIALEELADVLTYADARGLTGDWVDALRALLRRTALKQRLVDTPAARPIVAAGRRLRRR